MRDHVNRIITAVMDILEESVSTMTIASGKRLLYVFFVTVGFLALAILLKVLGYPAFISWEEALAACAFIGIISSINVVNHTSICKFKKLFMQKVIRKSKKG